MELSEKPIGIFDSGLGGLTVARAIAKALPNESIVYLGDTKRCPYGTRPQDEVRLFVRQVGTWFAERDVKAVIVACNTATAAGLDVLQKGLDVPVLGVIEPGARAAIQATHTRSVGVMATQGTVDSGSYPRAIHALDAGVKVTQVAAGVLVDIVEQELARGPHLHQDWMRDKEVFDTPAVNAVARTAVEPLLGSDIDTVVLGCTHFPLLSREIRHALGPDVRLVSSAEEIALELTETLRRRDELVSSGDAALGAANEPIYRFATTSDDITAFAVAGSFIFGHALDSIEHVNLDEAKPLPDVPREEA
jgi:glutamate racemase